MKKKMFLIIAAFLFCIMFFAKETDAGHYSLNLTNDSETIYQGDKLQLKIGGVKSNKVKWVSENKGIATVSKKGVVTGISEGRTRITGKYKGIQFKLNLIVVKHDREYNMLLAKNKDLELYFYKIEDGQIYLKIKNKTDKDLYVFGNYFYFNDDYYYKNSLWDTFYAKTEETMKLKVYNEDYNEILYYFIEGKFKGQIEYYSNDCEIENTKLKFTKTIK